MEKQVDFFDLITGIFFFFFLIKLVLIGFRELKKERQDRFMERPSTWLQYSQPPLIFVMIVLVYAGIGTDSFGSSMPGLAAPFLRWTGLLLIIAGLVFAAWAVRSIGEDMQSAIAVNKGHVLRTEGAFAVVRHPMYLSLVLLGLGAGLSTMNPLLLGFTLCVLAPVQFFRARIEEKLLVKHFGRAYADYRRKTPMIFPFRFR
jgi:protein-S-isoprenylcysteine O-methyltransferase Ste14